MIPLTFINSTKWTKADKDKYTKYLETNYGITKAPATLYKDFMSCFKNVVSKTTKNSEKRYLSPDKNF